MGVIDEREGHLDVLVNNAASCSSRRQRAVALKVFDTNAIVHPCHPIRAPLLRSQTTRSWSTSPALGSFWPSPIRARQFHFPHHLRASKAAVSMLTVQ